MTSFRPYQSLLGMADRSNASFKLLIYQGKEVRESQTVPRRGVRMYETLGRGTEGQTTLRASDHELLGANPTHDLSNEVPWFEPIDPVARTVSSKPKIVTRKKPLQILVFCPKLFLQKKQKRFQRRQQGLKTITLLRTVGVNSSSKIPSKSCRKLNQ